MNDRYLYKAKKKNWRELPTEEQWVVGYIVHRPTGEWEILGKCNNPPDCDPMWRKVLIAYEIDPTTLCACTGLKDKNGKLIWENDICDRKEKYPEIVKYHDGDWTLDYSYASNNESGFNYCNLGFYVTERNCVEVLGNIFDNPELLEVKE